MPELNIFTRLNKPKKEKMETRYVKLNFPETINSKKSLLAAEINLLTTIKKIQSYNQLRALELKKKVALKARLNELRTKMNSLKKILPNAKISEKEETEEVIGKTKRKSLELELREIKDKLASLSQ